ncbi:GPR1/FUN34/yaaH family protein [Sulfobacillus acidophilus TPY]|uniref:GPR1/FUN34/yaaH family protein n=1 Tax=Sulfobacillus acidophilus (strain ATCC 700253 / DSM 10332 / NAL) TaxID=679936 RepID=G8TZS6_SULAD|nr:GPR1/FUN34/yaaH family protein [Sulfobacillus acidophilus TPY]AEW06406.1 GPR1/FUN34/yaaH family protein [Sulfobacillus acidophilus DSM 10332]MCY0865136.1 acetate uptake transporter [Sulfobacillus sp.]
MEGKLGNPGPLGLAGFALTTWMLSMINAGWFDGKSLGLVLALAMAYGGTAQLVAGVLEFRRGNTFGTVAFFSYGAFWWSFALFAHYFGAGVPAAFVGWYLFLWGVFTFYMWLGTFRATMALQLVFLALWVTFVLLAIGAWGMTALTTVGGYVGMITAILAFYLSAAEVLNEMYGRTVLPVGPFNKAA